MSGLTVEDIDLVVRGYGPIFGIDDTGRFRIIELKHGNETVKGGQTWGFKLIDELCRAGDPDGFRYDGFYIVRCNDLDWEAATEWVITSLDGQVRMRKTRAEFIRWFQFDVEELCSHPVDN